MSTASAPLLALALLGFCASPGEGGREVAAADQAVAGEWRRAALWDDGNAELCAYEVSWARYGQQFSGRALLVLVKEPWAPELDVKADTPRADGFDVLKLNHLRDVPTGIYTYHQAASVYLRRDDASLVKLAATSSEACGVATAYLRDGELATHSYFDGVGDRRQSWPAGALPEDALPALLRDWVTAPPPAELLVFPSLLDSRLADLAPRRVRLSRRDAGVVEAAGEPTAAVELRLEVAASAAGEPAGDSYLFARAPPHQLLELRKHEGTVYRLARCGRLRYWEMHDPGGEQWLPPTVR
jgi:hypothetical protein